MKLWLIRHGMTKGNQEHRYVGTTDEGILPEERERLKAKAADMDVHPSIVFVSPARRCRETAECLFPNRMSDLIVVPEFMEMNFGVFEYKTWQEINQDPNPAHRAAYQRYIDSNGETAFPGGESKAEFTKRVCDGFERIVRQRIEEPQDIAIVAHDGTIMALMERYAEPHKPYFEWNVKPGEGYRLNVVGTNIEPAGTTVDGDGINTELYRANTASVKFL